MYNLKMYNKDFSKKILEDANANEPETVEYRRWLHRHAELSNEENETVRFIREKLEGWGIPCFEIEKGGILGHIRGASAGKSILLRADMDALPIKEEETNLKKKRECISEREGVMHACGHDAHTAMLLSAAKIINEHKSDLSGDVWFMFERGEEGTQRNFEHFYEYIDLNKINIDRCYSSHVYAEIESGLVGICDGPAMAGRIGFNVALHGKGGHGSRPDICINPIDCYVRIHSRLMEIVREYDPFAFSVGTVNAGDIGNTIPAELKFSGTARMFSEEDGESFRNRFLKILEEETAKMGASYDADITHPSPAINNNITLAEETRKLFAGVLGAEHVIRPEKPWMASESFALTMKRWPGIFAFIGIANEDKGCGAPHHSPYFDIDESALKIGVACYVSAALCD